MIQNDSYIRTVIRDREREVEKYVEYNKIDRHYRESAASQGDSTEQGKNILSLLFLTVTKRLKGVVAFNNRDSLKSLDYVVYPHT